MESKSGVSLPLPPAQPPAPGFLYPPTQPPPSSAQAPASGPAHTAPPTLRAGAGLGGVSGKVQSWAVASSRCSGIWPRRKAGSVPLVKCGEVCGGAGPWRGGRGGTRPCQAALLAGRG